MQVWAILVVCSSPMLEIILAILKYEGPEIEEDWDKKRV
jgi:hypothetical protein